MRRRLACTDDDDGGGRGDNILFRCAFINGP